MNVTIRLFASLRELAGADRLQLELAEGARVADALAALAWLTGEMAVGLAVKLEYADRDTPLEPGDELALIPPVSGGASPSIHVRVSSEPLSVQALLALVADPRAGAIVTFSGVTRDVPALEYEAYAEMAERHLEEILAAALRRHGLCAAAAEHRVGTVALSEASVVIAASAPHRAEAFDGARDIIDEIKRRAPIWKREEGLWVAGQVPDTGPGLRGSGRGPRPKRPDAGRPR